MTEYKTMNWRLAIECNFDLVIAFYRQNLKLISFLLKPLLCIKMNSELRYLEA